MSNTSPLGTVLMPDPADRVSRIADTLILNADQVTAQMRTVVEQLRQILTPEEEQHFDRFSQQ